MLCYLVCFLGPCPSPAPLEDGSLPWFLTESFFGPSFGFCSLLCFSDLFSFSFFFLSLSSVPMAETGLYSTPARDLYCAFSWRRSCTAVSTWSFRLTKEETEKAVFNSNHYLSSNVQSFVSRFEHTIKGRGVWVGVENVKYTDYWKEIKEYGKQGQTRKRGTEK